jgi:DNA-directed RNA polymerase specialized sigma24 family protein
MAGSRDADFMEFVRVRSLALRRTAYLLCGDWSAGDDLVQESLAKVYVAWPRIAASQAVESYTRTTMLRTYLNEKRKWRREVHFEQLPEHPTDDQDTALTVTLSALLRELPTKQRAVLVLRFYQDLSVPRSPRSSASRRAPSRASCRGGWPPCGSGSTSPNPSRRTAATAVTRK